MRYHLLGVGFIICMASACSNQESAQQSSQQNQANWTEEQKKHIMDECLQDARNNNMPENMHLNFCNCMLEKIMIAYPDGATARGSFDNQVINDIGTECQLSVQ